MLTYLLIFIVLVLVSILLNNFFLKKSNKFLIKKANSSAIRWDSQTKPIFGGVTFYVIFLLSIMYYIFSSNTESISPKLIAIFMVGTISFIMGLADDMIDTSPSFKFIVQVLSAIILISVDIYIDASPYQAVNYIITLVWVVGIMNSINMLDNMDAITTSVSITIVIGVIVSLLLFSKNVFPFYTNLSVGVLASLIGFLFVNWHPAKMYMGDNGSQFLGVILATLGILFYWNLEDKSYAFNTKQFVTGVLAFIVPISDTTTVTINRLLRGQSPFVGGKDHTTHHLFYMVGSARKVALILIALSLMSVSLSVYINYFIKDWQTYHVLLFGGIAFVIFISLYLTTKIFKPKE